MEKRESTPDATKTNPVELDPRAGSITALVQRLCPTLVALLLTAFAISGCGHPLDGLAVELTGPGAFLRVFVSNQSTAPFTVDGNVFVVGGRGFQRPFFKPETASFDLHRAERPLARVTYRVLKVPARDFQDVTIDITEPAAGAFVAATGDGEWIEVLSVQPL